MMVESDCTITFQGKRYEANGALIMGNCIAAYVNDDMTKITDWHGNPLGNARVVTSWATPTSYVSSRYYQIEATVNGITYTGRSAGSGMLYKGKAKRI